MRSADLQIGGSQVRIAVNYPTFLHPNPEMAAMVVSAARVSAGQVRAKKGCTDGNESFGEDAHGETIITSSMAASCETVTAWDERTGPTMESALSAKALRYAMMAVASIDHAS